MFEKGTRLKLRFAYKGLCTIEDLWDLPETTLDTMFKALNSQLKTQKEESLLDTKSKEETILALKIAIIKHIVEVKLHEKRAKEDRATKKAQKEKIKEILAKKQDAALEEKSEEELTELLKNL